jgi:hypothetical protein
MDQHASIKIGELIMRQIKFLYLAIVLCMIAISTMSFKPYPRHHRAKRITITAVYNFATFPNVVGTFTTGGASHVSGTTTMAIHQYANGTRANCDVVLTTPKGTVSIRQHCNLAANYGTWKIVCGTGAYEELKGHGTLTMPPNTEAMTGVLFEHRDRDDRHGDKDHDHH